MAVSQNGYPAGNRALIHNPSIPGTNITFPGGLRKGAVTVVLLYVAIQWHRRIEPLVPGWNWGYAERRVVGGADFSNHYSGTAADCNAPRHPLGVRGTFTSGALKILRQIEYEVEYVVRFGEFYSGRVDGMHVEINAPLDKVERVAAKLLVGPAQPPPPPLRRNHNREDTVVEIPPTNTRAIHSFPVLYVGGVVGWANLFFTPKTDNGAHNTIVYSVFASTMTNIGKDPSVIVPLHDGEWRMHQWWTARISLPNRTCQVMIDCIAPQGIDVIVEYEH